MLKITYKGVLTDEVWDELMRDDDFAALVARVQDGFVPDGEDDYTDDGWVALQELNERLGGYAC